MTSFKSRIEKSSLGTRQAQQLRSTVPNQVAARAVARAAQSQKATTSKKK
jgi:hypothetical protein